MHECKQRDGRRGVTGRNAAAWTRACRAALGTGSRLAAVAAVTTLATLMGGCAALERRSGTPQEGKTGTAMGMDQVRAEIVGDPIRREFDGTADDLLTAGLGEDGLRGPPPGFANPLHPTPLELRRRAIYMAWRGLVDVTSAGGFGRHFGPAAGQKVPGVEYLVAVKTPDGRGTTSVLLQIPASFDAKQPCLIAVASSGSRGIYGALPTAGEWGLRHGCAVVHTDKGTGMGVWDLDRGHGIRIDGTPTDDASDPLVTFAPPASGELAKHAASEPHTMLFKHAQSGTNPEADWGTYLLQAIRVAFELLNAEVGGNLRRPLTPDDTIVIAAGISNGGAAVLRALEKDRAGWIDGAIALEPNAIVHGRTAGISIDGGGRRLHELGIALYDYTALHYLYQPCAMLAETDPPAAFAAPLAAARPKYEQWCRSLQERGFLPAGDVPAAAAAARERLREHGMLDEGLRLGAFNVGLTLWPAITTTYAWAYSRFPAWQPPCGVSFAPVDATGRPRALTDEESLRLFSDGSGIAPTGGVMLVAKGADGERRLANEGSVDLAICLAPDAVLDDARRSDLALPAWRDELVQRVRAGQQEIVMSAQVGNRPVIVLHGRADSLIPVNHTSRAYYAVNRRDRGDRDELRYYELQHGQHFDAFLAMPGFVDRYVPMQAWMNRSFEAMFARLQQGVPLPPSQVLRSRPRGAGEALGDEHLGRLQPAPGADEITFERGVLHVPD
jgi:hydroxybutyrate-dimer hydrolase